MARRFLLAALCIAALAGAATYMVIRNEVSKVVSALGRLEGRSRRLVDRKHPYLQPVTRNDGGDRPSHTARWGCDRHGARGERELAPSRRGLPPPGTTGTSRTAKIEARIALLSLAVVVLLGLRLLYRQRELKLLREQVAEAMALEAGRR
ncbi:MAG TPA: hypothetical protein VIJ39_03420 [Solirubrobacteraceae bacterium]